VTVLAVDLAAKYSAACVMTEDGDVVEQWDSFGIAESDWVSSLVRPFLLGPAPEAIVIEDLPHRLKFSGVTKAVSRLQGRIYQRFDTVELGDAIVFVSPATWRANYRALKRGTGPDAVVEVCAELGYTPPDVTARTKGLGGPSMARKIATDYCAAFLIARWAIKQRNSWDRYDVPGTSLYGEPQKLKPKREETVS
jgi:hypothetical protein